MTTQQVSYLYLPPLYILAALSYGIYKTNLSETDPIHVLFLDMGHTSMSVSVVEFLKVIVNL